MTSSEPKPFNLNTFQTYLTTRTIGRNVVYRRETDTTMRIATEQAKDGASDGTIVLADYQTAGKGRKEGRTWESIACKNLLFTIIFRVDDMKEALKLAVATPCAVVYAARKLGVNAWVKWPNDVWIGSKKASGFLADNPVEGVRTVGIGINVNERFDEKAEAVSFADALGRLVSREKVLAHVCNCMERLLALSYMDIVAEYSKYDKLVGNTILVMPNGKEDAKRLEAVAVGFNDWGHLVVRHADNKEEPLSATEVTIRPQDASVFAKEALALPIKEDVQKLITGTWKNQLGSEVVFVAKTNGSLKG